MIYLKCPPIILSAAQITIKIYMKWNEILKQERISKNLTQKQVAEFLQIARTTYTNYETGQREPSFEMLRKICDFYGITADYLIGRTDY